MLLTTYLYISHAGTEVAHHEAFAIAPKGMPQETGQLGVAVGHMLILAIQSRDHLAECAKAAVDRLPYPINQPCHKDKMVESLRFSHPSNVYLGGSVSYLGLFQHTRVIDAA